MADKPEICSHFFSPRNPSRKTCAEIVREARQSLRVQSTRRPFTPRDAHRQLFGTSSVRVDHVNRPPSSFSLHAQNFEAPDSRPGSGTRLAPLDHKPKFPVLSDAEEVFKLSPKPPAEPPEVKRGLSGPRARLLRAGSLPLIPPVQTGTDGKLTKLPTTRPGLPFILFITYSCNIFYPIMPGSSNISVEHLCDLCHRLHCILAEADMLSRRCKRRSGILRALFRLIDLKSAQLNLHIAKLCLELCVSGNNLLNICKLIFQISRTESNDIFFQNNSFIDSLLGVLLTEEVPRSGEALLYCVGTLKFLSGNMEEAHFTIAGHILVQLTATLRNLAEHPDSRPQFVSFAVLSELCLVLQRHRKDPDICTNISRIYSKLSSYSECRIALAQNPECYGLFLELLSKHHQKQDLVVRLLFTLVNLTAKVEEARLQLFECDGCMDTLLRLYDTYQRRSTSPRTHPHRDALHPDKTSASPASLQEDDVLVKLVSVLANMCIHPAVGPSMANNTTCIQLLMETLGELRTDSEELLVNVAATINNLSFYQEHSSVIRHNQLSITKLLLKLMLSSSSTALLEATRVYGNMSLSKEVRDFIMENRVHRFVVTLLDSRSTEVCFSACGVLTNLAMDPPNRHSLSVEGAPSKLLDCLRDFGPADWQLAGQVCQALWNLITGGSEELLDNRERNSLLETLTTYLDKVLHCANNEHLRDYHMACWELEFQAVAQKLIRALESKEQTD
uniref:Armadillo repeat containing 2 n=1 Tax=Cynoglossus semilaevis TaxID=244447 RepID=A0A3P8WRS4_CYNSE